MAGDKAWPAPSTGLRHCPECDLPLDGIDIRAHLLYHYPYPINANDPRSELAAKRRKQLLQAAAKQEKNPDVEDE